MATAGSSNPPPIQVKEERGLTEIQVHCDIEVSDEQLANINSRLQCSGLPPIESRRRRLRWAIPGDDGGFWEFRIELYILEREPRSLHFMINGDKLRTTPSAHRRSRRTVQRASALANALFREEVKTDVDCSATWHSSPDSWLLPNVLPLNPPFPENSVIQEISGVIGGSTDGTVRFLVDRASTDPMLFHVWLGFKHELLLSPKVMVEAIDQGVSILEDINLWET